MKKAPFLYIILLCTIFYLSCKDDMEVVIPNFDYPQSVTFEQNLSNYNIFEGSPIDLISTEDFHLLELSSALFTDYAKKQRLIKLPSGTQLENLDGDSIDFPDETILVKTFYYYNDESDVTLGKEIIETRLMVKDSGIWNVATYIWNDDQQDAILLLAGAEKEVSWINSTGIYTTAIYHIPDKNECIACHQSDSEMIPLGTTLKNMNRDVERDGATINQLEYLQTTGLLASDIDISQISQMADYNDSNYTLSEQARAYLHMNCAHCHNPSGWEEAASQDLDLRYETEFNGTGLSEQRNQNRVNRVLGNGRMPFIGTTILDAEGIGLIEDYINSL